MYAPPVRNPKPSKPAPFNGDPKARADLKRINAENRAVARELRLSRLALEAHEQHMADMLEQLQALVALLETHAAAHPKVQAFIAAALARTNRPD